MKKKKFTLDEIRISPLDHKLDEATQKKLKGGYIATAKRGRVRVRWTSVDIRSDRLDTAPGDGAVFTQQKLKG